MSVLSLRYCSAIVALVLIFTDRSWAAHRSATARHEFSRLHPCPDGDAPKHRCPGWVIDHIVPLCSGGDDSPQNMQWQAARESYMKDIEERRACRLMRK